MPSLLTQLLYFLCLLTSIACMVLLLRGYRRSGMRLLLWSGLCFVCLALNNLLLIIDVVLIPEYDLRPYRLGANLAAGMILVFGFIWEAE